MTVEQLIALCHAKLASLSADRTMALRVGDVETIARLDVEIAATTKTIDSLTSL